MRNAFEIVEEAFLKIADEVSEEDKARGVVGYRKPEELLEAYRNDPKHGHEFNHRLKKYKERATDDHRNSMNTVSRSIAPMALGGLAGIGIDAGLEHFSKGKIKTLGLGHAAGTLLGLAGGVANASKKAKQDAFNTELKHRFGEDQEISTGAKELPRVNNKLTPALAFALANARSNGQEDIYK